MEVFVCVLFYRIVAVVCSLFVHEVCVFEIIDMDVKNMENCKVNDELEQEEKGKKQEKRDRQKMWWKNLNIGKCYMINNWYELRGDMSQQDSFVSTVYTIEFKM